MNRLITILSLALVSGFATASPLVGTWASKTSERGALPGYILFEKDGRVILHPAGFDPAPGRWVALATKPPALKITLDGIGETKVQYSLKKGVLTLVYDNGNTQSFTKSTPAKSAATKK